MTRQNEYYRSHGRRNVCLESCGWCLMDIGLVVASGIVVLALVAISVYGARTLPPGSMVPVHHGIGGWNNWQPKKLALIVWPATGVLVFGILLAASSTASASGKTTPAVIAPIVLLVVAFSYYNAIRAALRQSGRN